MRPLMSWLRRPAGAVPGTFSQWVFCLPSWHFTRLGQIILVTCVTGVVKPSNIVALFIERGVEIPFFMQSHPGECGYDDNRRLSFPWLPDSS